MNNERVLKLLEKLQVYLPNYRPRPGQQQMALAVADAIANQQSLLVEGGTGIGKSMAYLVPALYSVARTGGRVLIATSHKPLQDQISKKDIPVLAKLFKAMNLRPFEWVTLKGISNYICWHSVDNEQAKIVQDHTASKVVRYALSAGSDFSGDFEELPFNVPPETRALLSADSEDCLGPRCPHRDQCYALHIRRRAEEADVVVTNHSLLSLDIRSDGAVIPGNFATYIIDEGHNFEDNATKANGLVVTLGSIRRLLNNELMRELAKTGSFKVDEARTYLDRLQQSIALLWADRAGGPNGRSDNEDENKVLLKGELPAGLALAKSLEDLLALLKNTMPKTEEEEGRKQRLLKMGAALIDRLERISALADPNLVYYAERTFYGTPAPARNDQSNLWDGKRRLEAPATYTLYAMPIDVSGYLEKWFEENTVIITSATLSDGQNFDFFKRRLGIRNPQTLIVPSPFDYTSQVRLFLPQLQLAGNNGAGGGQFYNNLAAQIAMLLNNVPDGRALVLFTSYAALEGVWRRLSGVAGSLLRPPRPVFRQGDAQMSRIIADFQATENGVIFGTRSWWQGVDLPGMRMVVMDKLPFPQLNDPIVKARIEDIEGRGRSSFNDFMLPMAIITFRQGFGRLMRQEDDYGVVVVCDERIVRQRYGSRFVKGLPNVPVLKDLQSLREFLYSTDYYSD